jgi:hypothetical protein
MWQDIIVYIIGGLVGLAIVRKCYRLLSGKNKRHNTCSGCSLSDRCNSK